jgi:hypothetical protein
MSFWVLVWADNSMVLALLLPNPQVIDVSLNGAISDATVI